MRTFGKVQCRKVQREPEVFAAAVRVRTAASLSRHNSETTSKPYPIPNTYEEKEDDEKEEEEEERVKFNEIRSGVLNKISGLDSTRVPPFLTARLSERTSAATKKVGWRRRTGLGRSDYSNQSRDPTEQIEVAVIYDPGDGAGGSAAIFHPKITMVLHIVLEGS